MSTTCPFCAMPADRIIDQNDHGFVIRDGFPISEGHTLIISKKHIGSFFELNEIEQQSLLRLVNHAQRELEQELKPDGFNVGINDGPAAGQTVPHLHIHLIPRYQGDQQDPRGGVRWIIPEKANYWDAK